MAIVRCDVLTTARVNLAVVQTEKVKVSVEIEKMAGQPLNGRTFAREEDIGIIVVVNATIPSQDVREAQVYMSFEDTTTTPGTFLFSRDNATSGEGGIILSESTPRRTAFKTVVTPTDLTALVGSETKQVTYNVWVELDGVKQHYTSGSFTSIPARPTAPV